MTLTEFKAKLKSDSLGGFYVLAGEEDYLKNHYRRELYKLTAGDDAFSIFNYVLFDGEDFSSEGLYELMISPPMMADYKVIEWRHADLDKLKESECERLLALAEAKEEYPHIVFIITTREDGFETSEKRPSKLHKRLTDAGFSVLLLNKSTDNQLILWLKRHFDNEGISVDMPTLNAMLFRVGHSMAQLNEEVTKLVCYAKANGRESVSIDDVNEVCSVSVECDAFALSNAIIEKNVELAFLALTDMKMQRIEPYVVLAQLSKTYADLLSISLFMDEGLSAAKIAELTKFHPYRLSLYMNSAKKIGTRRLCDALSALIKTDGASKMGGIGGYGAIEMFITENI